MKLAVRQRAVHVGTGGGAVEAARPTLIFIHGAQQDHFCWLPLLRRFAGRRNALAPDLPGHGDSEGPQLESVEAIADWLADFLDALGLARATLVGHSMGALAALEAAARVPRRVAALALLGIGVPMPVSAALLEAAAADEARAMAMINLWSHSAGGRLGGENRTSGLWIPVLDLRLMQRQPRGALAKDLAACDGYRNGLEAAARVACPTLVVVGGADRMTPPAAAAELAGRLRHGRVVALAGAGHALMSEQPEALARTLQDFLADHD